MDYSGKTKNDDEQRCRDDALVLVSADAASVELVGHAADTTSLLPPQSIEADISLLTAQSFEANTSAPQATAAPGENDHEPSNRRWARRLLNGLAAPVGTESLTLNQPYGLWSYMTRVEASFSAILWVALGTFILAVILSFYQVNGHLFASSPEPPQVDLSFLGLRNAYNLDQVLFLLPWAIAGCLLTSTSVAFVSRRSRSRQVDWTDSHLFLEYSGPLSLALKWSAVETIDQVLQWELFHGKQPVFIVTTHEGNVFRLRLSDITQKHDIGEFFSLIKTNAPSAMVNVNRDFSSDNSYTELWLKYFSTPAERKKTGLLQKDMVLDGGRYRIFGTVGGGGQGTAYLALVNHETTPANMDRQEQSNDAIVEHIMRPNELALKRTQQVIVKEYVLPVHRGQLTAERTAEKLRAEADILQRLHHPRIVEVYDAFVEDYRGYLVLEYVSGESLKALIERVGPQPEVQVIDWALQACTILRYLHGLTIVHRDIAPDNLILQDDGTIKLVDFNVAYQVDSSATATVVGKHAYIPAEQFRGKPTPQSDIYALGGTLFYLLTGHEPEPITQSHPRNFNAKVSPELDEVVARATANSLSDRFATVDDLADALRRLATSA